ncbi:MAG: SMC family ATPase [Actinomycetaceae bacterium]|nr:SMC family ATPase [Actinomycetaceae bacterium]
MRLHHLTLQAIGPFPTRHSLDFTTITSNGIFLLDGPTGSGKSTIINAIIFALYGEGAQGKSKERIRSTHASEKTLSYVDLVFSVESGTYYIHREPAYEKTTSTNTTRTIHAKAQLIKLHEGALEESNFDDGTVLATRASDVGILIKDIIGLDRTQFMQTMILPQGEFARFLVSKNDEKEKLLTKIFHTSVFSHVTDLLDKKKKEWEEQERTARESFTHALHSFGHTLPDSIAEEDIYIDIDDTFSLSSEAENILEHIDNICHNLIDNAQELHEQKEKCEKELSDARQKLDKEKTFEENILKKHQLTRELEDLHNQEESIHDKEKLCDQHRQADKLIPLIKLHDASMSELTTVQHVCNEKNIDISTSLDEIDKKKEAATQDIYHKEQTLKIYQRVCLNQEKIKNLHHSIADLKKKKEFTVQQAETLHLAIKHKQQKTEELQHIASQLPHKEENLRTQEEHLHTFERIDELTATLDNLISKEKNTLETYNKNKRHAQKLTQQWYLQAAAALAKDLEEESPCPVCGSCTHPNKAMVNDNNIITEEDVNTARAAEEESRAVWNNAHTLMESTRTLHDELSTSVATLSAEELRANIAQLKHDIAACNNAQTEYTQINEELNKNQKDHALLLETINELSSLIASKEGEVETLKTLIDSEEKEVLRVFSSLDSIDDTLKTLRHTLDELTEQKEIIENYHRLEKITTEQVEALEKEINDSIFTSVHDACDAHMEAETYQATLKDIEDFHQRLHAITKALDEENLRVIPTDAHSNVKDWEEKVNRLESDYTSYIERLSSLNTNNELLQQLQKDIHEHADSWKKIEKSAAPYKRLADYAKGSSSSLTRIPLAAYALKTRFELMTTLANERLEKITQGRYELVRSDNAESGQRKAGLGLKVIDNWGSPHGPVERSTSSLSGGETFFVSLSLALALADVVQSENGGISMETLIIDEGFGTLDENTLANVMNVLHTLHEDGRCVGIISHIDELKNIITEGIDVIPNGDGTSRIHVKGT